MPKLAKYRSGFSQIIALIILSVVAISSFVVASKLGNQSQELRSRAQTYTVSPTPFGVSIDCMSDVNPHNFCATATYCPDGFTKISGFCKNSGACCKKDLAPCISTANPNNFCATATYCPTGFTKISGYCTNSGACCKKDLLPTPKPTLKPTPTPSPIACMSTANPNNFCVTATYCPTGSTKISGYCANSGACCKKDLAPCISTANPNNFCATATYCPTGSTKISGYCANSGACCKRNLLPTPSPRVCVPPNVCHYGECSTGYSMISDKCEGTNIVCCKPKPSPTPTPITCNLHNSSNRCFPYKCNPGYVVSTIGTCTSVYDVCCMPGIITKPFDSLTCFESESLIGWKCDSKKVSSIFEGKIPCPGGPTKDKGCRLYCDPYSNTIKKEYCYWIPDNADTKTVTDINGKPFIWHFCPSNYRKVFTEVINNVISIFPRNGSHITCLWGSQPGGWAWLDVYTNIGMYCNLDDLNNSKCHPAFVHELMHAWQFQENISNLKTYSGDNDEFNRQIGCRNINQDLSVFEIEDAVSEYGRKSCAEALADGAAVYAYGSLPNEKLTFDPVSSYKTKRKIQYNFMKGIFGGREYITSGSQQFNVHVSPIPKTSPILNTNSF